MLSYCMLKPLNLPDDEQVIALPRIGHYYTVIANVSHLIPTNQILQVCSAIFGQLDLYVCGERKLTYHRESTWRALPTY